DSSGGFLLSPAASTRFIDLARSASVAVAAGAQTVPIDGETNLVRLSSDPTPGWRAEWVNIPVGDMGFEKITLRPKTLAVVIPVSVELSEDSSNLGSIIEAAIREQMGLLIDKAVLFGQGSESIPQGIRFTTGINTITSFGTPADFVKFVQAVEKVLTANYSGPIEGLALILHPRDMSKIQQLKETGNQPLIPPEWFARLRKFSTTSLSITEGGGGAESSGYLGDFSQVLLGVRTQIAVRVLDQGAVTDSSSVTWNAAAQLGKLVVAHTRLDVAVLRPAFFVHMSGITIT
ncbi:MAG: phage major capsid protein, partial [Planctomycetes bacterium]|nr:phage major capsid protein [Planctomycetota bacterium]